MTIGVPQGYRLAGVHCGIKKNPDCEDISLIVSDVPSVAAGVYTRNVVRAAPVEFDRQRTPSEKIRVVAVNSGNANACTGPRGQQDTVRMAETAALECGVEADSVLVMSTGIIGEYLPMDCLASGIKSAARLLDRSEERLAAAARGMMTTDTVPKIAGRTLSLPTGSVRITGLAKGSGMIAPQMGTMLGVVLTDAMLEPLATQRLLSDVTDRTFNCITVDGHTSTNDTVLLLANGQAQAQSLAGKTLDLFRNALEETCADLARAIAADGEGATHLVTIEVHRCKACRDAHRIAQTIANSPLVKTAIAGADPNWGRIVSAAGYAGVGFDLERLHVALNDISIFRHGAPVAFDAAALSDSIRNLHETRIVLDFKDGEAHARFWTCDLTSEYVRINAEYHT